MKSRRLTFYLLREDIADFDDALDPDKSSVTVEIDPSTGIDGRFFYVRPQSSVPTWVGFVQPLLTDQLSGIRSASTSALLLLRTSGRIFALTFGYGRSLLDLSKIEYQFGLRVALNRIDPRQIRSLDTKTFEDLVVSTNTQASKSAELPTFGVDISRDILRAVTGEPRDQTFSKRIAGADSLVMGVKTPSLELPAICDDLLTAFTADDYKTDFGWIDQLSLVRDDATVEALNDLLVAQLRTGSTGSTHLAMPETIDWEDIGRDQAREIGRVIASIHSLSHDVVADAGLPVYSATDWRMRLFTELTDADEASSLPLNLLERWEDALEKSSNWKFEPTVVHGDIDAENFLWSDGGIATVTGFGEAKVADPAMDLAPFLSLEESVYAAVIDAYEHTRGTGIDDAMYSRMLLMSELAIPRWLMHGVRTNSASIQKEARSMLDDLSKQVAEAES